MATHRPPQTETLQNVVQAQLLSLDDTDCYASAWSEALQLAQQRDEDTVQWGGRGKGGRGLARRTVQPKDVVVEDVRLAYLGHSHVSLEGATLKLLSGHVYALLGRNGCGKSTLLRRIHAGKIPGLSPHLSTLYIPQEVSIENDKVTPLETVLGYHEAFQQHSKEAAKSRIQELEIELEALDMNIVVQDDDGDHPDYEQQQPVERICDEISSLEEQVEQGYNAQIVQQQAKDALAFFGIENCNIHEPCRELSGGQLKKVILAAALFCRTDLLLLDEPNHLDVHGLIQLRRLIAICQERQTTVLLVTHDVDLINDIATDIVYFANRQLYYYPGNYDDFKVVKQQEGLHHLRQHAALEKKREHMLNTLDNLKKQAVPKRGGAKKKARGIESHKKKLERAGITKDEKGHRWTAQKACSGIQNSSINAMDASARKGLSAAKLLKQAEIATRPVPDKALQFVFRNTTSTWGEPLLTAMDVGHGYQVPEQQTETAAHNLPGETLEIVKTDGYLFDYVSLSVDEGSKLCILGQNGCGKSTLLRLLAKKEQPIEGSIYHPPGLQVGYFDQLLVDTLIEETSEDITALSYLTERFPQKTEQDLRGELTSFGLNPTQATTCVRFLSGGERGRLCLAALMLENPPVLCMDNPTSNLDVESVEAMVYGLSRWNGTLVFISHDANFIRSLEAHCVVIMHDEGKLRRVEGGIDAYLKAFKM